MAAAVLQGNRPAVLGAVSLLIDADKGLLPNPPNAAGRIIPNGTATTVLLILAVGACFAGAANSVRELIKERVIYERERATGLSCGLHHNGGIYLAASDDQMDFLKRQFGKNSRLLH